MTQQIKATVIGFSREDCKRCLGRGLLGRDYTDPGKNRIIPCRCVDYFLVEEVQKSWEDARQAHEKNLQDEISKLDKTSPIEEFAYPCGIRGVGSAELPRICPEHGETCKE